MASVSCCGTGPFLLNLWVYPAVLPQATLSATGGAVGKAGNATITGTLDCTGTVPAGVSISGTVTQPVGRTRNVSGSFTTSASCASAQTWSALAQPGAGKFGGGAATVNFLASTTFPAGVVACNLVGCAAVPSTTAVIRLQG
jgi:hypothetical protein